VLYFSAARARGQLLKLGSSLLGEFLFKVRRRVSETFRPKSQKKNSSRKILSMLTGLPTFILSHSQQCTVYIPGGDSNPRSSVPSAKTLATVHSITAFSSFFHFFQTQPPPVA
jgi:hypothetical protein